VIIQFDSSFEGEKEMKKTVAYSIAAIVSATLNMSAAVAGSLDDHYVLNAATVKKLTAAIKSMEKADLPEDTPEQEREDDKYRIKGELPVERYILGIERRPDARALVAKNGFTPREFGLATYAMTDAMLFLTYEKTGPKADVAKQYAKLTKEQQANVDLLRKLGPSAYAHN
jgi:hypothetical protein